ncbi:MAG: 2OG-Fe(II) oxygenase [Tahibacter sp.]
MLNPALSQNVSALAARFARREPFRHVVIDEFFNGDTAAALLGQFPPFGRGNARNEDGELGNKSTVEKIRGLGSSYAALDDLIQTPEFLALIGRITGIPDLRYDPWYFGGGTHENRSGQDLDAHVDFNRHPVEPWHRRLNLIVYLNPEWNADWGGVLELHSDPRSPDDRIERVIPGYNRAVIFETTEFSWHSFTEIHTPAERPGLSRRSIALYFYSTDRPVEELAATHSTIYVDRPLPPRFKPGHVLDAKDVQELAILLARRDQHNQRLYGDISRQQAQIESLQNVVNRGLVGRLRYYMRRVLGARK